MTNESNPAKAGDYEYACLRAVYEAARSYLRSEAEAESHAKARAHLESAIEDVKLGDAGYDFPSPAAPVMGDKSPGVSDQGGVTRSDVYSAVDHNGVVMEFDKPATPAPRDEVPVAWQAKPPNYVNWQWIDASAVAEYESEGWDVRALYTRPQPPKVANKCAECGDTGNAIGTSEDGEPRNMICPKCVAPRVEAEEEAREEIRLMCAALQRAHDRLNRDAAALHAQHDYSAEFPYSDAEQIAKAIAVLRGHASQPLARIECRPMLVSGMIVMDGPSSAPGRLVILIDSEQSEEEKRAALWHEVAHLVRAYENGSQDEGEIDALGKRLQSAWDLTRSPFEVTHAFAQQVIGAAIALGLPHIGNTRNLLAAMKLAAATDRGAVNAAAEAVMILHCDPLMLMAHSLKAAPFVPCYVAHARPPGASMDLYVFEVPREGKVEA